MQSIYLLHDVSLKMRQTGATNPVISIEFTTPKNTPQDGQTFFLRTLGIIAYDSASMVNFDLKHYEPNNEISQQARDFKSPNEAECVVDIETRAVGQFPEEACAIASIVMSRCLPAQD